MSQRPVLVWSEIAVSDLQKACEFYAEIYGYEMKIDTSGPRPMAVLNGESEVPAGNLYPGKPAGDGRGNTVHLALAPGDTVEAASARVEARGGGVTGPLVEMPFGRWSYATDPDGNPIGLFEPKG
jgi:predicted enzyme related to lactoylglutathione lyase